jgi:3-dehydroquinate synthase
MILHHLQVDLKEYPYPIYIGEDILNSDLLSQYIVADQVMIVTNNVVEKLYLAQLKNALQNFQCDITILPDGEQHKTLASWEKILNALADHKHHRDSTLITLGGGVIGDMAGFASACYQRGIAFIQVPTTLLAQVDSSIGGKTGVNHSRGKNLIGAFHQPKAVMIDLNTLQTLPRRELNAGLAEIVKAALIADNEFFVWLETNYLALLNLEKNALAYAIYHACRIKKDIVVIDEKENNIRALLNLGHTFGHAIEHILNYGTYLHGEAVAIGLVMSARLSQHLGHLSKSDCLRIENLLQHIGLPTELPSSMTLEQLQDSIQMDKKVKQAKVRFVLLEEMGSAFISDQITSQELKHLML